MSEDTTLEQLSDRELLINLTKRFEAVETQIENIREGITYTHARLDQIESISLDAKSIALQTRSQLTILTEEIRQMKKESVM